MRRTKIALICKNHGALIEGEVRKAGPRLRCRECLKGYSRKYNPKYRERVIEKRLKEKSSQESAYLSV